ncbi:DUF389 domain-containing protein [Sulfurovum sp.]|uniref:DUF389 domain-containing protein n=1 Tax=Sulfurovum sp. TaxID=1969726 RepID=UPI003561427F
MIYYIYAEEDKAYLETVKTFLVKETVTYISFTNLGELDLSKASHLLVTGCIEEIKMLMSIAHQNNLPLGIIPRPTQKELIRTFALETKTEDAVEKALKLSEKKIDLLYCNGSIVIQEVVVGDAPPLDQFDTTLEGKTFLDRIKLFWSTIKKVKTLKHTQMKITDAKDKVINLSAVGAVGLEYNNSTFAAKLVTSQLSGNDGRFSLVVLSPASIVQYVGYLFSSLVSHWTPKALPKSVGYIRSSKITIESQDPIKVLIDSSAVQQTPVDLEVKQSALALGVGDGFWEKQSKEYSTKDSMKVDHLPSDKENTDHLSQSIPLFSHASQSQYTTLFKNLREESRLRSSFMILLILATMIATFGLFINSSSVVIGAMLLAPLMQPIVSLSMGVLRQDSDLELNGAKTIAIGVIAVLSTAAIIAFFTPMERLTSEMAGRLSPTILDLFVAIVSGVAAAYAKSNEKILGSLAGVAIAVALVPPLAVAGIGLGWVDWHMFGTAFLLFITNLVGIVLAAALTFVILGFSPLHIAKKGILIWMTIVAVVAIPLYSSFNKMQEDIRVQTILSNLAFSVGENDVKLLHIELVHRKNLNEVRCEVMATGILTKEEKLRLKEVIQKSIGKKVEVIATFRYRL